MLSRAPSSRRREWPAAWRQLHREERLRKTASRRVRERLRLAAPVPPRVSAAVAGLRHVNDQSTPGICRIGPAKRFRYVDPRGRPIKQPAALRRIKALAVPPAWTDVWICPQPDGHLQATGRDARGRKQYRYHPRWRGVRDEVKYGRLVAFARTLPRIRACAEAALTRPGLPREKVVAAVVLLLEKTLIRVGNEEYARENGSIGLTTMRNRHARIRGGTVRFEFRGKSRIEHAVDLHDARLTRIIKACRDLPGHELFQYVDERGRRQAVESADVNKYLRAICGEEFTAKDFRTWAGTVLAASALAGTAAFRSKTEAKRKIARAIESVAHQLGNTKAVCRKCYIHPAVLAAYMDGATIGSSKVRASRFGRCAGLSAEETAVVRLIEQQMTRGNAPLRLDPAQSASRRTRPDFMRRSG
jgi:DNA topoisomerase-1